MIWFYYKNNGRVTAALVYDLIVNSHLIPCEDKLMAGLWDLCFPLKIKCFVWLALKNQILTWDNLVGRGWHGPGRCGLCLLGEDSVQHLFVDCSVTKYIFAALGNLYHYKLLVSDAPIVEFLESEERLNSHHYYTPFFVFWCIWNARNKAIFEEKIISPSVLTNKVNLLIHRSPVMERRNTI